MAGRLVCAMTMAIMLGAAVPAWGGGWATVGLSSLPDGTPPGGTWVVDLTILQHARTPLEGVRPAVIVRRVDGGPARAYAATPTGRPGVYRARVMFGTAGRWRYVVDDGFTARHSFAAVDIGPRHAALPVASGHPDRSATTGDDGGSLAAALLAALVAGVLATAGVTWLRRPRPDRGVATVER